MSKWSIKISNQRLRLGHSRKKMALLIGISESSLRSYETDKRDPNYRVYEKINKYYESKNIFPPLDILISIINVPKT
jgi:DNA-binding XRE family transcriptional regulator